MLIVHKGWQLSEQDCPFIIGLNWVVKFLRACFYLDFTCFDSRLLISRQTNWEPNKIRRHFWVSPGTAKFSVFGGAYQRKVRVQDLWYGNEPVEFYANLETGCAFLLSSSADSQLFFLLDRSIKCASSFCLYFGELKMHVNYGCRIRMNSRQAQSRKQQTASTCISHTPPLSRMHMILFHTVCTKRCDGYGRVGLVCEQQICRRRRLKHAHFVF